jgi:hypothetical protein
VIENKDVTGQITVAAYTVTNSRLAGGGYVERRPPPV